MPHMQISVDPRHTRLALEFMQSAKRPKRLPSQASSTAQSRAFGQQGDLMRPTDFQNSPQGQAVMKRIIQEFSLPSQASPTAQSRAFGQQNQRRRKSVDSGYPRS